MKTLKKGRPIQGDLQTLYKYYFSPGGGHTEALQLAEGQGLLNALEVLIENQTNEIQQVKRKMTAWCSNSYLNPPNSEPPILSASIEFAEAVVERHATTGVYEIGVNFRMFGEQANGDKLERFCNSTDFHVAAVRGKSKIFTPNQVPQHLMDDNFRRACFRAAQGLQNAIHAAREKFIGFDTQVFKELKITHNLPYYPAITTHTPILRYVEE